MTLQTIEPGHAKRLIDQGAVLVDIREPDEHAREHIPGARNLPIAKLAEIRTGKADTVIFHCRSGARTASNSQRLASAAGCEAYILDGGIDAWRKAGLPVAADPRQPIEIMRQVQITAGGLVLLGAVLGTWLSPAFYGLSAFVGAGLVFAGISGWCGMAKLLALMPWNRQRSTAAVA
jgi:rhodanese-related sulfurtransferase